MEDKTYKALVTEYYQSGIMSSPLAAGILEFNHGLAKTKDLYKNDVDELTSRASLKILRSLEGKKYKFLGSFEGFMKKNFNYCFLDYLGILKRRDRFVPYTKEEYFKTESFEPGLLYESLMPFVDEALKSIPVNERRLFNLLHQKGFSIDKSARMMKISNGAARTKDTRTRQKLVSKLESLTGMKRKEIFE